MLARIVLLSLRILLLVTADCFARVKSFGWSSFWFPLIIITSLLVLFICFAYRWHDRSTPAACAWLLFPLAPVLLFSRFPANDMAHDRYLYIPSIYAEHRRAAFSCLCSSRPASFGQLTS